MDLDSQYKTDLELHFDPDLPHKTGLDLKIDLEEECPGITDLD